MESVGVPTPRLDALDKVTGQAKYAGDLPLPGALHLKLALADRPHARIRLLDVSRARQAPGVAAVLTGGDVPYNLTGVERPDKPVLCDQVVRCVGDAVALVAAETPEQAAAAAALVRVEYEDLPVVDGPLAALADGAPQLHAGYPGNVAHRVTVRRGDVEAAFRQAHVVYAHTYCTPMQEHAFLEPEAGVAYVDGDGCVRVITAGQDPHEDRRQVARMLDLPEERVRVSYGAIGGSFGGREDVTIQPYLALAAWKLGRPVRMAWSRQESILCHPKRHAMILRYRWAADRQGRITAAECDITSDAGAYLSTSASVLDNYRFAAIGPYDIPNVRVDARTVYTNNLASGAFRGFGTPQAAFAAELQVEHLAELLGLDPVTVRLRNALQPGGSLSTGSLLTGGSSLPPLIEACARHMGIACHGERSEAISSAGGETASSLAVTEDRAWVYPPPVVQGSRRIGVGLAAGVKNTAFSFGFPESCAARVVLHGAARVERAEVFCGASDVGQGAHTVLAQFAAQALELPLERIELHCADSGTIGAAGPASASRLTFMAGNAVCAAAREARQAWQDENRPAVGEVTWHAPQTIAPDPETGATPYHSISFTFGVEAVRVEVDMETGQVRLLQVAAAHDPGRAVNPLALEGQVQGGIVQAQGWALLEDFVTQGGRVLSDQLSTYLVPTALDVPPVLESLMIEMPDPLGPYGARGMGEIPFVPLAPAVAAAVHHATGVWVDHLPIRPGELLQALASQER